MTALLLVVLAFTGPMIPDRGQDPGPGAPPPEPLSIPGLITLPGTVTATVPAPGRDIVVGVATWYGTGPGRGHAAAGPRLRSALGPRWRGTSLRVCAQNACVSVVVDDWCACGGGHLIDLSDEDFSALAPLSRGVITITAQKENP